MRSTFHSKYKQQVYRDLREILPAGVSADFEILSDHTPAETDAELRRHIQYEFEFFDKHFGYNTHKQIFRYHYGINLTAYTNSDARFIHDIAPSTTFLIPHRFGFTKGPKEYVETDKIGDCATMLSLLLRHFSFFTDIKMRNNFNVTAALMADEMLERQLGGNVTEVPLALRGLINHLENEERVREIEGDTALLYR